LNRRAIYPGSFDPIHLGHVDIATRSAAIFDELIVAIYERPSKNLMFTVEERVALAGEALAGLPNVRVTAYAGLTVDLARCVGAQVIVRGLRVSSDFEWEYQMAFTNRRLAPEIEFVCLVTRQEYIFMSSSIVKEVALLGGDISQMAPPSVVAALEKRQRELEKGRGQASMVSLRD